MKFTRFNWLNISRYGFLYMRKWKRLIIKIQISRFNSRIAEGILVPDIRCLLTGCPIIMVNCATSVHFFKGCERKIILSIFILDGGSANFIGGRV